MTSAANPTPPRECALAIGLPLTSEEFLEQLQSSDERDFAKHVKRSNFLPGTSDDYYWEHIYSAVAHKLQSTCDRASDNGVKVVSRSTLADLANLFAQSKVVTIVAHWRFISFAPEDIVDPAALFKAVTYPSTPLHKRISLALTRRSPAFFHKFMPGDLVDQEIFQIILDSLNETVRSAHEWYQRDDQRSSPPREPTLEDLQRLTRPVFEQAFPGILRPGRAIELADGMHTIGEITGSVKNFDGLIDLTLCNSVILGASIKRQHPDCTVAVIRYPADIMIRAVLYDLTLNRLARKRESFMAAMAFVHSQKGGSSDT